jgi:hypothetical protein
LGVVDNDLLGEVLSVFVGFTTIYRSIEKNNGVDYVVGNKGLETL